MTYKSLRECITDLERHGHLLRIKDEVDPNLEMAEIHRYFFAKQGPALYFERVRGSKFPAVSNLFGTPARAEFIFRKTLSNVKKIIELKADPTRFLAQPWRYFSVPFAALKALPKKTSRGPVLACETTIDQLPLIKSWPDDGGAFITLPQVLTEDVEKPGVMQANIGMYRIQMNGNQYATNQEIGLHYQIHRGIGVHHAKAIAKGVPFRVSIFIGGPPAHTFAAVMPLPEGLSEATFAGMLAGRRFRFSRQNGYTVSTDADFCIIGTVDPDRLLPEGPFGDHLGYYSLAHPFPVLKVEKVYHRADAIWPFTVVGRPPQEDTGFGKLIHEITAPMVPKELPGLKSLHAVDAAGVHPLLLAIGSERYAPYEQRKPQEILTTANAILGFGQCSLAKYLMIVAGEDDPALDIDNIPKFLGHFLERVDWRNDLHFQTATTIDTLDYSGTGLNQGSKVVMAAAGKPRRKLATTLPEVINLVLPKVVLPGVIVAFLPKFVTYTQAQAEISAMSEKLKIQDFAEFPLIVLVDDPEFCAQSLNNFLWVCFTRSNPSHDIYGVKSFVNFKHWGCDGPLLIDARIKPHHAPPIVADEKVAATVRARFASYSG